MRRLVFYTGAGMSRESGLPTFRGQDGLGIRSMSKLLPTASRGTVVGEVIAMSAGSVCLISSIRCVG